MVIKSTRLRTSSGCRRLAAHLAHGAENENVVTIQGTVGDLVDAVADAQRLGRVYALRHWIIAPAETMTREQFTTALHLLATEFAFDPGQAVIYEHDKARANKDSFARHWHVVVPEVDPATGRTLSSSHDFLRHEKIARIAEYQFGHRPVQGAHHLATLSALRGEGRVDGADWLGSALPETTDRPQQAFSTATHQARKRDGLDVAIVRDHVRAAWNETADAVGFQAQLAAHGLCIRFGDRAWIVETDAGAFVGRAQTLARVRKADVAKRMEAQHDDPPIDRTDPSRESDFRPGESQPDRGGAASAASCSDPGRPERRGGRPGGADGDPARLVSDGGPGNGQAAGNDIVAADGAVRAALGRSLTIGAIRGRRRLSDLTLEATKLAETAADRLYNALDKREWAANHAMKIAEVWPPEPDDLTRLRDDVASLKSAWQQGRNELGRVEEELEGHEALKPRGLLNRFAGANAKHEQQTAALQRLVEAGQTTNLHLKSKFRIAENRLYREEAAWRKRAAQIVSDRRSAGWAAEKELAICAAARVILQKSPRLAYAGFETVFWVASETRENQIRESDWNGLTITDLWGVAILEPRTP